MPETKLTRTVLVTGADGMLGNSVVRELLAKDYTVHVLVLESCYNGMLDDLPVKIHFGDITIPDTYIEILNGCDYLINCAAITKVYPRKSALCRAINNTAVEKLAQHAMASNIKRFVHVGTANSFGGGSKDAPGNETKPFDLGRFGMDYITSKHDIQQKLLELHKTQGLPVLIVNPTYMIGPFDSGPSSGKMLLAYLESELPGYTEGGRCFAYSVDVAKAIVNGLELGRTGECYIAGGNNLSYKELLLKLCEIYNIPFKLIKIPDTILIIYGFVSSVVARITGKAPVLSYGMTVLGGMNQFYSSNKAAKELNYKITDTNIAIKDCVEWFKKEGMIKKTKYAL